MFSLSPPPHLRYSANLRHPLLFPPTPQPPPHHRLLHHLRHHHRHRKHSSLSRTIMSSSSNPSQPPRTLFPGGYKRPEIKVPNVVLRVTVEEVLSDETVVDFVDKAVSGTVGIVVLSGDGASGGKLYEVGRLLNSVIKERAYFVVDERVDIAAAVNATGVLLSDQGLPTIVARNTMSDSRSESVVLPLVARYVQTSNAALEAADAEGADFLIYRLNGDGVHEDLIRTMLNRVKIPIFVSVDSFGNGNHFDASLRLLELGVSGLVLSLKDLKLFSEDKIKKLLHRVNLTNMKKEDTTQISETSKMSSVINGSIGGSTVAGFIKLEKRERELIEIERSFLLGVIEVIRRAAPLMEELSLLTDAFSQLDDPFLLVIVGEFNSGKSTVINALLGEKFVKDGVVPTTNEITFLRYSEVDRYDQQRCERHPDGQYACYLPAPILKEMIIVDTPGTNVILQRQQRLTEEFVPRADLILFVISADRPLTESEVNFLRYIQQWKKRVIFVLNKSDLYRSSDEMEEAIVFIENNVKKLLNIEDVLLFPVSARSALEEKLYASSRVLGDSDRQPSYSQFRASRFSELENYLYSFLDGSTTTGIERMKLKLSTPVGIAEQLLSACQKTVREECQQAKEDLALVSDIINSVEEYAKTIERESFSWKRRSLSLIDNVQSRVLKIAKSTLQLSNLDIVTKYIFKGERSTPMPVTATIQNDIIDPALSEAEKLITEYTTWLQSTNAQKGRFYREALEKRWSSSVDSLNQNQLATSGLLLRKYETSIKLMQNFNGAAVSKKLEKEIRETFLVTFGGLGAAGLSASLLTSVLPSTLEDVLALGLCSAGGLLAISNFPVRRQRAIDKVKRTADALARELEDAMQNDLLESSSSLANYVKLIGKPYQEAAQDRLNKVLATLDEIAVVEKELKTLQTQIQNLHVSQ